MTRGRRNVQPVRLRLHRLRVRGRVRVDDVVVAGDAAFLREPDPVPVGLKNGAVRHGVAGHPVVVAARDPNSVLAGSVDDIADEHVPVRLLIGLRCGRLGLPDLDAISDDVADRATFDAVVARRQELDPVVVGPFNYAVPDEVALGYPRGAIGVDVLPVEDDPLPAGGRDLDPLDDAVVPRGRSQSRRLSFGQGPLPIR